MTYIYNPKTEGSGIICAIPQTGRCPMNCSDCFFQSGRSYLEPLDEHLPNMPSVEQATGRVVRVNDGNDSHNGRVFVEKSTAIYQDAFFNTSIHSNIEDFSRPVVLTLNPGPFTDTNFWKLDSIPKNLMFVRLRVNTWNLEKVIDPAVKHYTSEGMEVPVVTVYVTGPSSIQHFGPPVWNAIRNWKYGDSYENMTLHETKVFGSVKAIAWYIEEGFDRVEKPTGIIPRWS